MVDYPIITDGAHLSFNDSTAAYDPLHRTTAITSSATPTPNSDTTDIYSVTALEEAAEFQNPTGTPVNGQKLLLQILDDGTGRALTWDTDYSNGIADLPSTTIASTQMYVGLIWNSTASAWYCLAAGSGPILD